MAAPAWLIGGLVFGALALATSPSATQRQQKTDARRIRQTADRRLLRRLVQIAEGGRKARTRAIAWQGASLFKQHWIDAGRSGDRPPAGFRREFYGHWCGPGYGSGRCIDEIDCACKDHDYQYEYAAQVEDGLAG